MRQPSEHRRDDDTVASMREVLVIVFVIGCNGTTPPPSSTGKPQRPPTAALPSTSPPPTAAPQSAVPGVYAKACQTECADDLAQLVSYRDPKGAIAIVTVQGSPARCSHPPLRFLGPDGTERAVVPLKPVVPGSEEATQFDEIRAKQLDGLTKGETMFCRDVKH
jgi:hypothetical protein